MVVRMPQHDPSAPTHAGHLPAPELVAHVAALIAKLGVMRAARDLGIGRESLARLAGGLHVRAGTIALAERSLSLSLPSKAVRRHG